MWSGLCHTDVQASKGFSQLGQSKTALPFYFSTSIVLVFTSGVGTKYVKCAIPITEMMTFQGILNISLKQWASKSCYEVWGEQKRGDMEDDQNIAGKS